MNRTSRPLALVTGASGGIGAELARELARHGHDLVLAARSLAPMQALAAELQALGAAATVIAADLAKPGAAATLADELAGRSLAINVLVNNAGLGAAGRFDRIDPARTTELLQVNVVALTELDSPAAARHGRPRPWPDHAGRLGRRVPARSAHGGLFRQQGVRAEPR